MNRRLEAGLIIAGVALIGVMYGHALTQAPAHPATGPVTVNCGNQSANDGPESDERDITAQEWARWCVNRHHGTRLCPTEDSTDCYWDASAQGNGLGHDVAPVTAPVQVQQIPLPSPVQEDDYVITVPGADGAGCYHVAVTDGKPVAVEPDNC